MKRETIVYLNLGFFDTDVTVVKELAKVYDLHWFVLRSPTEPYDVDFFKEFVKGTEITLHLYPFNFRRRSLKMLCLFADCFKEIRKIHPSLIYSCCQDLYFQGLYLLTCVRIPLVMGIHDVKNHSSVKPPLFLVISQWIALMTARCYVLFSKNQHELFKQLYPNKRSELVGMSYKDFGRPSVQPCNTIKEEIKILFFGTLQPYKGYDLLIDAFERLIEEGMTNLRLSLYGRCGNQEIERICREKIKHPGFYEMHLEFVDNREIPDIFASHHFVVFPYRDATNSGPLMIAVNYGVPVIAPDHSCFKDVCTDGVNSLLYDNKEKEALYEKLKYLSQISYDEYMIMRTNCDILKSTFSEAVIAQNYINLFKAITIKTDGK